MLDRWAGDPSLVILPLRAFLGVTFCFAGLQKLANPNFFRSASPISIQAQLRAAARVSPIHGLLGGLVHVAGVLGFLIAVGELAIGLGVLTGVQTRAAALGGMVLSFGLFLTVSFHSRPYYTGADIGYLFAFTPLLIAGGGRLTLPWLVDQLAAPPRRRVDEERRRVLVTGAVAAVGVVAAVLDAAVGRAVGAARPPQTGPKLAGGPPTTGAASGPSTPTTTKPSGPAPVGTRIGPASDVPVGGAASFQDPASGDPAIVVQARAGQFVAFDAVCPHAGCTVEYQQSQNVIFCPCHGSLFNPASGAVETGPAASGLRPIAISKGSDGNLYAT